MQVSEQGYINYFKISITGLCLSFSQRISTTYKLILKCASEYVSQALMNITTTATPSFICLAASGFHYFHSPCTTYCYICHHLLVDHLLDSAVSKLLCTFKDETGQTFAMSNLYSVLLQNEEKAVRGVPICRGDKILLYLLRVSTWAWELNGHKTDQQEKSIYIFTCIWKRPKENTQKANRPKCLYIIY